MKHATAFLLAALLAGCRPLPAPAGRPAAGTIELGEGDRILVLAPHPDDEVLGAGGVLREAVRRGLPVRVVFLTSGDSNEWSFLAYRKRPVILPRAVLAMGTMRQHEALAATADLGVPAKDVSFLGYPDYGTLAIWRSHWGSRPPDRGRLTRATAVPYATAYRPGAPFKGEEILADLEAIVRDFRPTRIFVSHPADRHPDHAALYLFTRVALWDLQGEVSAKLYPFLVHYPHWPGGKGFHPGEELSPPPSLLAGFRWQTRELTGEDVDAKRRALAAHHTQYDYSASRLLPFVRGNELYGDLALPTLAPGAAADLPNLTVRLVKDHLEIAARLAQPLEEGSAVTLYAFGYRQDRPFGQMPKLAIRAEPHAYTVRDQELPLPRATVQAGVGGERLVARIPLAALGDPRQVFLRTQTSAQRGLVGQSPWWVLGLPAGTAIAGNGPSPGR
ncbi:MAG TPA: PIG-L family deacetylase [Thermoanaerobaculia bacterium]|nr:PIG-L family deacetylase [Thermoanaerobaculia bacterium]